MTTLPETITGGVDTHLDVHVAAALNAVGGVLGVESFPADGPATGACWHGSKALAPSFSSASKARAATEPA